MRYQVYHAPMDYVLLILTTPLTLITEITLMLYSYCPVIGRLYPATTAGKPRHSRSKLARVDDLWSIAKPGR